MNNNIYETLEICLNEIEQGADIDTVLFRYPDIANELRPILETSVKAKAMAVPAPSQDVVRHNRAKLLQNAAELREGKVKPQSHRIWSVPLRRALVTLMVVAVLFVSGTGLVRASSTTLPGDNLYPVKRTWEDALLLFTFDVQKRGELELEHENERLVEVNGLFAKGRSATVDFSGYVTSQNGTEWRVAGITVLISPETLLPNGQVLVGAAVHVKGQTQGDGIVHAGQIELLPADMKLPEVQDTETGPEQENTEVPNQQEMDDSGKGSETETPVFEATKTQESELNSNSNNETSNDESITSNDNGNDNTNVSNDNTNTSGDKSGDGNSSSKEDKGGSSGSGGGGDDNSNED